MGQQLFVKVSKALAILLLVCFFMSITITAVSAKIVPGYGGDYQICVKTGNEDQSGTDGSVYITLIGTKKTSREMLLSNGNDNFEIPKDGKTPEYFDLIVGDIGNVNSIQIRMHPGILGSRNSDWNLDYIAVTKLDTKQRWTFPYQKWIYGNTPVTIQKDD